MTERPQDKPENSDVKPEGQGQESSESLDSGQDVLSTYRDAESTNDTKTDSIADTANLEMSGLLPNIDVEDGTESPIDKTVKELNEDNPQEALDSLVENLKNPDAPRDFNPDNQTRLIETLGNLAKSESVSQSERETATEALALLGGKEALESQGFQTKDYSRDGKSFVAKSPDGTQFRFDQLEDGKVRLDLVDNRPDGGFLKYRYDEDGSLQGSYELQINDSKRTTIQRNSDSEITELERDNDTKIKVEYSEDGKPVSFQDGRGTVLNRNEDGSWTRLGDGKTFKGELSINEDSSYEIKSDEIEISVDAKGNETSKDLTTGHTTKTNIDGTAIETNSDGQVVRTVDAKGKESTFKYDEEGKLDSYKSGDKEWTKQADGSWKSNSGEEFNGERTIASDGAIQVKADGEASTRSYELNGSIQTRDQDNRITESIDASGEKINFEYRDGESNPSKITYGDARGSWVSTNADNTSWVKLNSRGQRTYSRWNGKIEIDQDGNRTETHLETGKKDTYFADGSRIMRDKNDNITQLTTANNETYKFGYDSKNRLMRVEKPDGVKAFNGMEHGWSYSNGERVIGIGIDQETGTFYEYDEDYNRSEYSADGSKVKVDRDSGQELERSNSQGVTRLETSEDGQVTTIETESNDGIKTRLSSDGSKEVVQKDGSSLTTNSDGQILRVGREDGSSIRFDRNENGDITKISDSNGDVWTSEDGKVFKHNNSDQEFEGKVTPAQDGSYTIEKLDSSVVKIGADRSISYQDPASDTELNFFENESGFARDSNGKIVDISDAAGRRTSFRYDENGVPNAMQEPDGAVWQSTDNLNWTNSETGESRKGKVTVLDNGSYTIEKQSGESTTLNLDGSTVSRDDQGRVTNVTNAMGESRRFGYNEDGTMTTMQTPDGMVWSSEDGKNWSRQGARGTVNIEVSVSDQGAVTERVNGFENVHRTDGWTEQTADNQKLTFRVTDSGTTVYKNDAGKIIKLEGANGESREFDYDRDGNMTMVKEPSGEVWEREPGTEKWKNQASEEVREFQARVTETGFYAERSEAGTRLFNSDSSSILLDNNGRKTEVTNNRGETSKIGYGADGRINRVESPDGRVIETTDGVNWTDTASEQSRRLQVAVNDNGAIITKDATTGETVVTALDGNTVTKDERGRVTRIDPGDGSYRTIEYGYGSLPSEIEVTNKDGTVVAFDHKGNVTRRINAHGKVTEFGYSEEGELNKLVTGTETWTTEDGKTWKNGDKTWEGQVTVNERGEWSTYDGNSERVTYLLDGNKQYSKLDGSSRIVDSKDRIVETVDVNGKRRAFDYDSQGRLNKVTMENGEVWTTEDRYNWTSSEGRNYKGSKTIKSDGTLYEQTSNKNRIYTRPDGSREIVNYQAMLQAAKTIEDATEWTFSEGGTDEEQFWGALEGKTVAQRQMISEIFRQRYGRTIEQTARSEMSGSDLERALAALQKGDGADNAGTIRVALVERDQWIHGRSDKETERVIRDTLETMSSAELAEANRQYRERYGTSLRNAILNDDNLSAKTKAAARIYLKGHENRTEADFIELGNLAIKHSDATMFQEAMRRAPKEAREHFSKGAGKAALEDAFEGHWYHAFTLGISGNVTDTELTHVEDYAKYGKLSVATQTKDNTSWLGDNEDAIEHSLSTMTDQERQDYRLGKHLSEGSSFKLSQEDQEALSKLSSEDKSRIENYYKATHEALDNAAGVWFSGNSQVNELLKWEDMAMNKDGTLLTKLADRRGMLWDDSTHDVIGDIENMSEADWLKLKNDPSYRGQLDRVLNTYLSSGEKARAREILDGKQNAESFEDSKTVRRELGTVLKDTSDGEAIVTAIENMSEADRAKYSENGGDNDYRRNLDRQLNYKLSYFERQAADNMLGKVLAGEKPVMDITDRLNVHAHNSAGKDAKAIRDIQQAFKDDPGLLERINNPQTPSEIDYARRFKAAASRALGYQDYQRFGKELIETGTLSAEKQMELHNHTFNDDEQGAYQDIQNISDQDKNRLLTDKAFQDKVLGYLSDSERQIALYAMQQGEMRPEDKIRSYVTGAGTSEDEIKQVFEEIHDRSKYAGQNLTDAEIDARIKQDLDNLKNNYATKYGESLTQRLFAEMGGRDERDVSRLLHKRSSREEFLYAQREASEARSGFGSGLTDALWDGTGFQMDNDRHALARQMVMDPDSVDEYANRLYKSIDMHSDSKEGMANAIVDTTIAAAAVGGAFFTGGVSLSLLAYTGLAGAAFKVGAKSTIMGSDYDWSTGQAFLDGTTGAFEGATVLVGAGLLKHGGKAGAQAVQEVIEAGGKELIEEGAEQALMNEAKQLVLEGFKSSSKNISDDAIRELAEKYAVEGSAEALEQMLKQSLTKNIEIVAKQWLRQVATESVDASIAGTWGAGGSGAIRGAFEADSFEEFVQITATSAGFGAVGGGTMGASMRPLGWGFNKTSGRMKGVFRRSSDDVGDDAGKVAGDVDGPDARVKGEGEEPTTKSDGDEVPDKTDTDEQGTTSDGDDTATKPDSEEQTTTGDSDESGVAKAEEAETGDGTDVETKDAGDAPQSRDRFRPSGSEKPPRNTKSVLESLREESPQTVVIGEHEVLNRELVQDAIELMRKEAGDRPITFGVEIPAKFQPDIDAFMKGDIDILELSNRISDSTHFEFLLAAKQYRGDNFRLLAVGADDAGLKGADYTAHIKDRVNKFVNDLPEGEEPHVVLWLDRQTAGPLKAEGLSVDFINTRRPGGLKVPRKLETLERDLAKERFVVEPSEKAPIKELEDATRPDVIEKEQFVRLVSDFDTPEEKLLAAEVLEQSAPNIQQRAGANSEISSLDRQLKDTIDELSKLEDPLDEIVVVVPDETSAGKALAYLQRTISDGKKVTIKVLDANTLENGIPPTRPVVLFDDPAKLSPEQVELLSNVPKLYATNLNGFERSVNAFDMAAAHASGNTDQLQRKMQDLVRDAQEFQKSPDFREKLQEAYPDLKGKDLDAKATEFAVSSVMKSSLDDLGTILPNARVITPGVSRPPGANQRASMYKPEDRAADLFDSSLNSNVADSQDIEDYLKFLTVKHGLNSQERQAVLDILKDGVNINSYSSQLRQIDNIHKQLIESLPEGKSIKDVRILTQLEDSSSADLIQTLYARRHGLTKENFVSAADFKANPEAYKDDVMVLLDDASYTGTQTRRLLVGEVDQPTNDMYRAIQESDADFKIMYLAQHRSVEDQLRLFPDEFKPQIITAETKPNYFGDTQALADKYGIPKERLEQIIGKSGFQTQPKDVVISGEVNPYNSNPNNNAGIVREYAFRVFRQSNNVRGMNSFEQPKNITNPQDLADNLMFGRGPKDAEDLAKIVDDTDADIIIDLRGSKASETGAAGDVSQTAAWAREISERTGKDIQHLNLELPDQMPLAGTPKYNELIDQLQEFQEILAKAEADGKKIYFHGEFGQDRTGMLMAMHEVATNKLTPEQAIEKWVGLKNRADEKTFRDLFSEETFLALVNDYRTKHGINAWSNADNELGKQLSNFAETPFVLDGQEYASIEAFYVSLRYPADQRADIAKLSGLAAKRAGRVSHDGQTVYNGETIKFGSPEHHELVKRALRAKIEQNPELLASFVASKPKPIYHDTGHAEKPHAFYPNVVFARHLTEIRDELIREAAN